MATAAKILGVAPASISKVCGVAKANAKRVMGAELVIAALIDSCSTASASEHFDIYSSNVTAMGMAITLSSSKTITGIKFYIDKSGSPTGSIVAKIQSITGTVGVSATPTGSALATSSTIDVSTLGTSPSLVEFVFSPAYSASSGSLGIYFEYTGGSSSNHVRGYRLSAPSSSTHAGNPFYYYSGAWYTEGDRDYPFSLYGY